MSTTSEAATRQRYAAAAHRPEAALCCPVEYDTRYLEVIPPEVIEKDYGCGDPSRYLRPGETVLDLGSGTGKICFIASQVVGPQGRVIGVDMTGDMLEVARRNAPIVAERLGYANVEFRKGRIQDLTLDLERPGKPLIENESVDVIVSNCVLNLVESAEKQRLFREIHRVLRKGGRAVISDIVSDEEVPESLRQDPTHWSGCISGAFTEEGFLQAFTNAGLYGVQILKRDEHPWRTVEGIEFRSVTVQAFKGKEGPCLERRQAVMYLGPFSQVTDDDGHVFERGRRSAVCDKTFQMLRKAPYGEYFAFIEPYEKIPLEEAGPFACDGMRLRPPRETKGSGAIASISAGSCGNGGSCC